VRPRSDRDTAPTATDPSEARPDIATAAAAAATCGAWVAAKGSQSGAGVPIPSDDASVGRVPTGRQGFALVLALVLLAALSAAALTVLARSRSDDMAAHQALASARTRHAAEGAIARAIATLAAHRDAGRPLPPTGTTWSWTVAGIPVVVDVEPESSKLDVNTGAISLMPIALDGGGMPPGLVADVAEATEALRVEGRVAASLASVLPPCARIGDAEAALARRLTVATRARGLAPAALPDDRLAALPGITAADLDRIRALASAGRSPLDDNRLAHLIPLLADAAPLATIRARVTVPGSTDAALQATALVQHEIGRPTARVIAANIAKAAGGTACEQD
jgi:plasmid stabilization system protein ParE